MRKIWNISSTLIAVRFHRVTEFRPAQKYHVMNTPWGRRERARIMTRLARKINDSRVCHTPKLLFGILCGIYVQDDRQLSLPVSPTFARFICKGRRL